MPRRRGTEPHGSALLGRLMLELAEQLLPGESADEPSDGFGACGVRGSRHPIIVTTSARES